MPSCMQETFQFFLSWSTSARKSYKLVLRKRGWSSIFCVKLTSCIKKCETSWTGSKKVLCSNLNVHSLRSINTAVYQYWCSKCNIAIPSLADLMNSPAHGTWPEGEHCKDSGQVAIPDMSETMKPMRRAGSCFKSLHHWPKLLFGAYTGGGGGAGVLGVAAILGAGAGALAVAFVTVAWVGLRAASCALHQIDSLNLSQIVVQVVIWQHQHIKKQSCCIFRSCQTSEA